MVAVKSSDLFWVPGQELWRLRFWKHSDRCRGTGVWGWRCLPLQTGLQSRRPMPSPSLLPRQSSAVVHASHSADQIFYLLKAVNARSEWKSDEKYGRESKGVPWSKPGAAQGIAESQPKCQQPSLRSRTPSWPRPSLPSHSIQQKGLHPLLRRPSISTAANWLAFLASPGRLWHEIAASRREGLLLSSHTCAQLSEAFGSGAATERSKKRQCM